MSPRITAISATGDQITIDAPPRLLDLCEELLRLIDRPDSSGATIGSLRQTLTVQRLRAACKKARER